MRKSVALLTFAIVLKIALLFVFHDKNENNSNNNEYTDEDADSAIATNKEHVSLYGFLVHLHG